MSRGGGIEGVVERIPPLGIIVIVSFFGEENGTESQQTLVDDSSQLPSVLS